MSEAKTTLKIFGTHDDATLAQMQRCLSAGSAVGGALCADGHLGYSQPVGGVVAYEEHISVSGVGYDIACGNLAIRLDVTLADIADRIPMIAEDISHAIPFGVGRLNGERVEHDVFDSPFWDEITPISGFRELARNQLGTVGSGNHYVDIFTDENDQIWIGTHTGSRGFGHKTASAFLALAGGKDGIDQPPTLLHEDSDLGQQYRRAMWLAGYYAGASREWIVGRVRAIIGGSVCDWVHNHHNYAWLETHGDRALWVVRKGATPAFPGQRGFVGGSMGDNAVILRGVDSPDARAGFHSTVHGAGRVLSRTQARGKVNRKTGEIIKPGLVSRDAMEAWLREKGVYLVGGDVDEAPHAYRRLDEVLAHHAGTVEIEHTLRPLIVVMAGRSTVDPYKD